jgi:hypothetical protein
MRHNVSQAGAAEPDNRRAAGLCFGPRLTQGFLARRHHHHVGGAVEQRKSGVVVYTPKPLQPDTDPQRVLRFALAEDHAHDPVPIPLKLSKALEEKVVALQPETIVNRHTE